MSAHGWPTARLVGDKASVYSVRNLLACQEPSFLLLCHDLMKPAVDGAELPEQLFAHVVDICAVAMSAPRPTGPRTLTSRVRPMAPLVPDIR
ncbi:hypothetical protein [Streptomyces sp. NPDC002082]|uniref:hypothetical protein n=1 Tax=Streptomyces sp. NPDC002082 TaxID=3154772 RepID=UPI00331BA892